MLKIGDKVNWSGTFGKDATLDAVVTAIQINDFNGSDNGVEVEEVPWILAVERKVIVSLDNGSWAWAFQISKK